MKRLVASVLACVVVTTVVGASLVGQSIRLPKEEGQADGSLHLPVDNGGSACTADSLFCWAFLSYCWERRAGVLFRGEMSRPQSQRRSLRLRIGDPRPVVG